MINSSPPPAWLRWVAYGMIGIPVWWLSYFVDRTDISSVWLGYFLPFIPFLFLMRNASALSWKELTIAAILIRTGLLWSTPNLSDDLYRFQWDGRLQDLGISAYAQAPEDIMAGNPDDPVLQQLFPHLNSPEYYSIYPPGAQGLFWLSMQDVPHSVFWLKCMMLILEVLTLYLLPHLLTLMGKLPQQTGWYALNPLVLIELSGNIHLETGMIAGCLLSALLLWKQRYVPAGIAMGMALSIKFTPLMILPLLWRPLGFRNAWTYYLAAGITLAAMFLPVTNIQDLGHIGSSIGLYFHTFEFNGSWFYLYRLSDPDAFWLRDIFRILFPLLTFSLIIRWSWKSNTEKLPVYVVLSLAAFLFLSGNVHPWYLTPLLAAAVFTRLQFPFVWAVLIPLTYITYRTSAYAENYWLVTLEYLLVYTVLITELKRSNG